MYEVKETHSVNLVAVKVVISKQFNLQFKTSSPTIFNVNIYMQVQIIPQNGD